MSTTTNDSKRWKQAEAMITKGKKIKMDIIKNCILKGLSYSDMGEMFGKHRQAVWAFYKQNITKKS